MSQPPALRDFTSFVHAAEHTCDHVLTRPEAHEWSLVLPDYRNLVSPTSDTDLERLGRSLFQEPPSAEGKALVECYVNAILRAIDDALRMGFWWEEAEGKYRQWHGLGLEGIYVVWDPRVIVTGYLWRSVRYPPTGALRPRIEVPLPRRNRTERLSYPPSDTPRARYELFQSCLRGVSQAYERAYNEKRVTQAGGDIFVVRAPRFNRWQQWIADRPGQPS